MIYIYNGTGASRESITHTIHAFKTFSLPVSELNEKDLLSQTWMKKAKLFVMPGGADVPYVKKLNGEGNKIIRTFVEKGGSYLGLCAGAYYGSGYVQFDKGGKLEVLGDRELAFFPGKTIGPILAPYDYDSKQGARAAHIQVSSQSQPLYVYFSGGPYFEKADQYPGVEILADYLHRGKKWPAIVKMKIKKGTVVLSGVHFEYSPALLDSKDKYLSDIIPALQRTNAQRNQFIQTVIADLIG